MTLQLPKIVRRKKRVGRGIGSRGAKSGRGQKGQGSRAGYSRKLGFEGGQTPLYMRLPKGRGTKQKTASQVQKPIAIPIARLNSFENGTVVGPGVLRTAGFLGAKSDMVKLIGNQGLEKKLTVRVHAISKGAQTLVEKAGGKVEIIQRGQ